jgi:replicative DNA helicase
MNGYKANGYHKNGSTPAVITDNEYPYNDDAERAVLGSLLIDPDAYGYVRPLVNPDDFYLVRHKWIYEIALELIELGETPDLMNVADRLERKEKSPEGGWSAYLIGLINHVPTSINAPSYAKIVQEYAIRRRLVLAGRNMATAAYNLSMPIDEGLAMAEAAALNLRGMRADAGVKTSAEVARSFLDKLYDLRDTENAMPGLPTGYVDIDRLIGGLEAQFYLLAARPGMGKSSLALGIALHVALKQKKRVMIFSLEMSEIQIMRRAVAAETSIPLNKIKYARNLNDLELASVNEASGRISQADLFIDATPGLSPSEIRAKALRKVIECGGLDLVIVDHIHLMGSDIPGLNGTALVSHLSKEMMKLPKILGCPVLTLAQLSRAVEQRADKRPQLSDLRDSGSLEEDAYGVMFIYRDDYYYHDASERPNVAEIIAAKNRDGEPGMCELFWRGVTTSFHSLQRNQVTL